MTKQFKGRLQTRQLCGYVAQYWGSHAREVPDLGQCAVGFLKERHEGLGGKPGSNSKGDRAQLLRPPHGQQGGCTWRRVLVLRALPVPSLDASAKPKATALTRTPLK